MKIFVTLPLAVTFFLPFLGQVSYSNDLPDRTIKEQKKVIALNQNSQNKIDRISDKTSDLFNEFRLVTEETDNLRSYNDQLRKVILSQENDAESIREQIKSIETTNKRVVPLMIKMLASLEDFVSLDIPFLLEERKKRISSLKSMMDRADVSTSEKYRRIMEAFQIENEYGRTIEAYSDTISSNGKERTVEFLRIGRIALLYRSLDGDIASYWDQKAKKWNSLDGGYAKQIKDGLDIAKKFKAPNLLTLPLQTPEGK